MQMKLLFVVLFSLASVGGMAWNGFSTQEITSYLLLGLGTVAAIYCYCNSK